MTLIGVLLNAAALITSALIGVVSKSYIPFIITGFIVLCLVLMGILGIIRRKRIFILIGILGIVAVILVLLYLNRSVVGNLIGSATENPWSTWSTTPVYPSDTLDVETRETAGYVMNVYVTQEDITPYHNRNFRNFSIAGNFETYYARESYGEKSFEIKVTSEQVSSATAYAPEDFIPNIGDLYVGGYNKSSETAYVIPIALDDQGRYYPLFIKKETTITEYRYRDKK